MARKDIPIDEDWLGLVTEEILEPDLPIVDPHHHLWHRNGLVYLLDDLLADTNSGHNVVATVFVQAHSMIRKGGPKHLAPLGETEFVNGIAAMSASGAYGPTKVCHGIVGHADLMLGDAVDEVLEAHLSLAPDRFKGIRHGTPSDPYKPIIQTIARVAGSLPPGADPNEINILPPNILGEAKFREGFARLSKYGLTFDSWFYHHQIPELTDLARAFPDQPILIDHFGGVLGIGPYEGKRAEVFEQWKKDYGELAACENVTAKLGGINMVINGFGWQDRDLPPSSQELADATQDYYHYAIDCFGPDRCMFESNFPVDKECCSYQVLWNALKRIASGYSADEKADMFAGTATRFYDLDL